MNKFTLGPNIAIFILFFGLALLEAFQSVNIPKALLLFLLGLLFLYGDMKNK